MQRKGALGMENGFIGTESFPNTCSWIYSLFLDLVTTLATVVPQQLQDELAWYTSSDNAIGAITHWPIVGIGGATRTDAGIR